MEKANSNKFFIVSLNRRAWGCLQMFR